MGLTLAGVSFLAWFERADISYAGRFAMWSVAAAAVALLYAAVLNEAPRRDALGRWDEALFFAAAAIIAYLLS